MKYSLRALFFAEKRVFHPLRVLVQSQQSAVSWILIVVLKKAQCKIFTSNKDYTLENMQCNMYKHKKCTPIKKLKKSG